MFRIEEFITRTLTERQAHLQLNQPCIERGGSGAMASFTVRGLLADKFDTTMPTGRKIHACHACNNCRCSNINHVYWGTVIENSADARTFGTYKSVWERLVLKYGLETAKEMQKVGGRKLKGRTFPGRIRKQKTKIQWPEDHLLLKMVSESSRVKVGKVLGVSNVSVGWRVKRIIKKMEQATRIELASTGLESVALNH